MFLQEEVFITKEIQRMVECGALLQTRTKLKILLSCSFKKECHCVPKIFQALYFSLNIDLMKLLMRHLFTDLKKKKSWNGTIILFQVVILDLMVEGSTLFETTMMNWNEKIESQTKQMRQYSRMQVTQAGGSKSARGFWTPDMLEKSINTGS